MPCNCRSNNTHNCRKSNNTRGCNTSKKHCSCRKSTKTRVNTQMKVCPKVNCRKVCSQGTKFDVDVDVQSNPRICVKNTKTRKKGCGRVCSFEVHIQPGFSVKPKVYSPRCNAMAKYNVGVDVDTQTFCRLQHH